MLVGIVSEGELEALGTTLDTPVGASEILVADVDCESKLAEDAELEEDVSEESDETGGLVGTVTGLDEDPTGGVEGVANAESCVAEGEDADAGSVGEGDTTSSERS